MLPFIGLAISAISSIAGSWLENRKAKAQGKIDVTKAKVQFRVAQYTTKASMDIASMNGMQFSWKDEYLVIILTIPIIMAFIPYLAPYAMAGFAVVKTMPGWYQWALTGIIAATFGLRTFKSWRG
jgi:hypothetical protein